MEKNTKLIAGLMIALIAIGTLAIVPSIMAQSEGQPAPKGLRLVLRQALRHRAHPWLRLLLKNGTPETFTGIVTDFRGAILVVQADGETLNVNAPRLWSVEGVILNRSDLFDGDPFALGETELTFHTLKLELEREEFTVTTYFAYILESDDVEARAVLPFNIETS